MLQRVQPFPWLALTVAISGLFVACAGAPGGAESEDETALPNAGAVTIQSHGRGGPAKPAPATPTPTPCQTFVACQTGTHLDTTSCACVPDAPSVGCVQNVLCVRTAHFDTTVCKCVPKA
jgi:hypothetical protein